MPGYRDSKNYLPEADRIGLHLEKRLATYIAAATAAGVAFAAASQSVEAKIIYTPTYATIPYPTYNLDFNHDGVADAIFSLNGDCSVSWCLEVLRVYLPGGFHGAAGSQDIASALLPGVIIGSKLRFAASVMAAGEIRRVSQYSWGYAVFGDPWANNGHGVRDRYLGLRFFIGREAHYGWVRISVQIPSNKSLAMIPTITGYAYETTAGKAIVAGQKTSSDDSAALDSMLLEQKRAAPTLGLLALGRDGLAVWRREETADVQ